MGEIMHEAIIDRLSKIENVIAEYGDVIEREADDSRKQFGIISAESMKNQLANLQEENRLLNIGIIGKVKAGKSSLLNSIFFEGQHILPKAATPMTASLTLMTYGDTFSATVEYFTPQDIDNIRKDYDSYKAEWKKVFDDKTKNEEERSKKRGESLDIDKVERSTDDEMKETQKYTSYEQYKLIKDSGIITPNETTERLNANSLPELLGKLNEFVGSGGKMTPFTKCVELQIPDDALRDICVVDTPGINDPVKSREARTEDYLKKCDVVFIISPAGQFISDEDTTLMDKLTSKEGVRQLYLVASQADNQLYDSIKEETKGDLNNAVKKISDDLFSHAINTLSGLKSRNHEVAGQFDQLINGGTDRVMVSSAICHAMHLKFDDQESWDNDMNHVWRLLKENYQDYFDSDASAKANLNLLSGIEKVSEKISLARKEKDNIIAQKQADYINSQVNNISKFLQELVNTGKAKSVKVKDTDIAEIKEAKKNTEVLFSKGKEAIDGTYEDCVDDFKSKIRDQVSKESKILFDTVNESIESSRGTKTTTNSRPKFKLFWIIPIGKEYYSVEENTLRTGAVKNKLNDLIFNLQDTLVNIVEKEKIEWKQTVQKNIGHALQALGDVDLIDISMLKTALRRLVNNLELPELDLGSNKFNSSYSGIIEGDYQIEQFVEEVESYRSNIRAVFTKARDEFLSMMEKSAKRENMSDLLFSNMKTELESLEKEIENRELTLERLKKCVSALENAV